MKEKIFGWELILDLYDCDSEIIKSKKSIAEYSSKLCKKIKMIPYGKPLIPHFGHEKPHTSGYSLVQLIETSSITGHFSELWNSAHINIFSCKSYNPKTAADFTKKFFSAKRMNKKLIVRKIKSPK
ncbi:MAG: S-adenosylmethionine decarboxylase [Candidatus Saelkia tenebricola]|nr:S-adenosylmethionine decarboxylase [Candidatus Saelkia tenebricola]